MKLLLPILLLSTGVETIDATVSWTKYSADLGEQTRGIDAADWNGDGTLDVVSTGYTRVFVILNPLKNQMPEVIYDAVDGNLLYGACGDIDDDGDLDFVIARGDSPWIDYREKRARREKARKPRRVPDFSVGWLENTGRIEKKIEVHPIDKDLHGCHGLALTDINQDGNLDVVGNAIKGIWKDSVAWYDNFQGKFVRHMIIQRTSPERPHYMDTADLNADGKPDVIVAHSGGGNLSWYQNPPSLHGRWKQHLITELAGVTNALVADIDGDRRLDVVASAGHGTGVYWYKGPRWQQTTVDGMLSDCHALALGDFDLDGDTDIATASFTEKIVRWYENDGNGIFQPHDIDVGGNQEAYDLKSVDLNKDGRLDLLLAGRATGNAVWYINREG